MASQDNATFCLPELCNVLKPVEHKWSKIGIQLGIPNHILKKFRKEDDPLTEVIDYWLKGNVKDATPCWQSLVTALGSTHVHEIGLAEDIRIKYCQQEKSVTARSEGSYSKTEKSSVAELSSDDHEDLTLISLPLYSLSTPPAKRPAIISSVPASQYVVSLKGEFRNSPISPDSKWPPTLSKKGISLTTVEHSYEFRDKFIGHTLHSFSSLPDVIDSTVATISPAISQYAAYLKGVYRNSPISPDSKWPPTPSKKYISLATVAYGYKCRDKFIGEILQGNVNKALTSRKKISIDEILVPNEEGAANLKLVLIEGAPGIGKSTLVWELCRRWEQGCMKKYSLTILLRLREKEVQDIRNIPELFFSCQGEHREISIKEISSSNGKGVLFILDGFDELPTTLQKEGFLVNLIKGTFLPKCTVLVTSRPSATAELLTICRPQVQKHIEVLGFTQESVEKYAISIFSSEPERLVKFKAFISASKNPAINSLMYVPLNAAIIAEIYRDSKSDHLLPHTLTQVYTQLCLTNLNRYLQTSSASVRVNNFKDLSDNLYQEFLRISEVAFEGMKRQEVIFHNMSSDLVHFGFLDADYSLYGGGSTSYNFLHLTIQEFFAAYHVSQLCDDARLAFFSEYGSNEHWNVVWRFVAGLTEFQFFEGHIDVFVAESKENEVVMKPLFIQCLFEANIKIDESKLVGLNTIRAYTHTQTPLDWYALGYCIANLTSGVSWNISVGHNDSANSVNNLVSGLKTSNITLTNDITINELCITGKYESDDLSCLKHFPLRGITDLTLFYYTFTSSNYLTELLPSMTSLKRLSMHYSTFPNSQCTDKLLQQLSKTSVTSLDIEGTDLKESTSALKHLINPLTGTLEELCAGDFTNDTASSDTSFPDDGGPFSEVIDDMTSPDNKVLLNMICTTSSLKSLKLLFPGTSLPVTQLQTNTGLTKLEIKFKHCYWISEGIAEILQHNKTLEHLIIQIPWYKSAIEAIIEALSRNSTLKSVEIRYSDIDEYEKFPLENCDPRIKWCEVPTYY